jgi:predicted ArsR family transcriptional regulator
VTATDPMAIRALAHPIRLDLLDVLTATGPATAAQCGRRLGQSQASCSFHLRQLAKYGFVEAAAPGGDRRERRWQVTPQHITMDGRTEPRVAAELSRLVVDREAERIKAYLGRLGSETPAWREAAGGYAAAVQVTVEEAAGIRRSWEQIMAPFTARTESAGFRALPGQRTVRYFMSATPMPDTPQHKDSR